MYTLELLLFCGENASILPCLGHYGVSYTCANGM